MSRSKAQTAHLMATPDDVEQQFYEALREADIDKLMALWSDDDEVVCVRPGGERVAGAQAIRAAFEIAFAVGHIPAYPEQVRRMYSVNAAVHSLVERIDGVSADGPRTGFVMATNVYLRTTQGWRIVAHHASPGLPAERQESAQPPSVLH